MTVPMKQPAGDIMESVLIKGDLAKLTPDERVRYYSEVCKSIGLNPLTKPFEFIVLNGKLQLYALRTCADQLRKINSVSLEIVSREITEEVLTVHVRAKLPDGRSDEDLGAVSYPSTLRGEARANAELKAVTKAKRRATLSICGLGWLDETEIEDIPASAKRPAPPAANVMLPAHNASTGELMEDKLPRDPGPPDFVHYSHDAPMRQLHNTLPDTPGANPDKAAPPSSEQSRSDLNEMAEEVPAETESERLTRLVKELTEAARLGGMRTLAAKWKTIHPSDQHVLEGTKEDLKEQLKKAVGEKA